MHANEGEKTRLNSTVVFNKTSWHSSAITESLQFQTLIISCTVIITVFALPLNLVTSAALTRRAGLASVRTTLFINLIVIDLLLTAIIAILQLLEWVYQLEDLTSKWRIKTSPRFIHTHLTSYLGTANNCTLAGIALVRLVSMRRYSVDISDMIVGALKRMATQLKL